MSIRTQTRRRTQRFAVSGDRKAEIEFELAGAGRRARCPLVDLSGAGISFALAPAEIDSLDTGSHLPQAVVRIGECEMRGELVVMHVTPRTGGDEGAVCGALFYPDSDGDLVKLKSIIAGMEALGSPER